MQQTDAIGTTLALESPGNRASEIESLGRTCVWGLVAYLFLRPDTKERYLISAHAIDI